MTTEEGCGLHFVNDPMGGILHAALTQHLLQGAALLDQGVSRAFQTEENNKPLRVLEIGCGTRSSMVPVLRAKEEVVVYACDCSGVALRKAIEVVSTLNGSTFFPFMCEISLENPSFLM